VSQSASLSLTQAEALLLLAGLSGAVRVTPVREQNHVWHLQQGTGTYYLKTYTKPWYGDDVATTAFCVAHEVAAWAVLASAGLAVPDVVLAAESCENPLGRPFLLTRELRGEPLPDVLLRERTLGPLAAVGAYLGRAHAIVFAYPGYIVRTGPDAPLAAGAWRHRCWTADQRQRNALTTLQANQSLLPPPLAHGVEQHVMGMAERLAPAYDPPHFVQGDCHAHQFFLYQEDGAWCVSGVIDMEVASSGDSGEDFLHLFSELAATLPATTRWWEAFFAGYGAVPAFDLVRLRFLGTTPAEYAWLAGRGWPENWASIVSHFLAATSWEELLTLPTTT
jgi:Ser/Thr protein kinase RdoA (MazF antagonist)